MRSDAEREQPIKHQTRTAEIWLGSDGIFRWIVGEGAQDTEDTFREGLKVLESVSGGKRRPLFVDIRGARSIDRKTRQIMASQESAKSVLAAAILIGSGPSKVIGNFPMRVTRIPVPARLFLTEREALAWIELNFNAYLEAERNR